MGGGGKKPVLDDDAIAKRKRKLALRPIGYTLTKRTVNSKKERRRIKNANAYGFGVDEADTFFGVQNYIAANETSVLECEALDDFYARTLDRPQEDRSQLVITDKAVNRAAFHAIRSGMPLESRVLGKKEDLLSADRRVDEFNSVIIPRRPFTVSSPDQIVIERAVASGRGFFEELTGEGPGTRNYSISNGFCFCEEVCDCLESKGKATLIPLDVPIWGVLDPPSKEALMKGAENGGFVPRYPGTLRDLKTVLPGDAKSTEFMCERAMLPWECTLPLLKSREAIDFIAWRDVIGDLERTFGLEMTPYERNLEYWRQLWRVVENSHLVLQILDARDPLFFRSSDLEQLVRTTDPYREHVLIMNKADFLPLEARRRWAEFFADRGVKIIFFSALRELVVHGHTITANADRRIRDEFEYDYYESDNSGDSEEDWIAEHPMMQQEVEVKQRQAVQVDAVLGETRDIGCDCVLPILKVCDQECGSIHSGGCSQRIHEEHDDRCNLAIKTAGELRRLLCDLRQEHRSRLQKRRNVVLRILQAHPDWVWWVNGVATKLGEELSEMTQRVKEESDIIQAMKTKKPDPQWLHEVKARQRAVERDVKKKLLTRRADGNQPKLGDITFTIGTVGYPNAGKSSLINALLYGRSTKTMSISNTPGHTKHFQSLMIDVDPEEDQYRFELSQDSRLKLVDCPGLVFPTVIRDRTDLVLNGVVRIHQMRGDRVGEVTKVLQRCGFQASTMYNVTFVPPNGLGMEDLQHGATRHFLNSVALKHGWNRGHGARGSGDATRVANTILHDYVRGRLVYAMEPPDRAAANETNVAQPVPGNPSASELKQFDIEGLFSGGSLFRGGGITDNAEAGDDEGLDMFDIAFAAKLTSAPKPQQKNCRKESRKDKKALRTVKLS